MADDNVTIAAKTIPWYGPSTGVELWLYSSKSWVTAAGTPINTSSPYDAATRMQPYKKLACTVNVGTHTCAIEAKALSSTEDALVNNDVTLVAVFMDTTYGLPRIVNGYSVFGGESNPASFKVPATPTSTTWEALALHFAGGVAPAVGHDVAINGDLEVTGDLHVAGDGEFGGHLQADSVSASSLSGNLQGNVTGNVTGNLAGNVNGGTGNFSGTVTAAAFTGNGAGITGLAGATGGVSNTGSTTIGADTNTDGVGVVDLQTRNVTRLRVHNDGMVEVFGLLKVPGVYNVRAYGAVGDGSTDDTSAVGAAVAALVAAGGGILYFPKGRYKTSGGFVISVPALIMGDGSSDPDHSTTYVSRVDCTSPTATLFTFSAMYGKIQNIALVNTAGTTPTAGAGIAVEHATIEYNRVNYDEVSVVGFFDCVDQRSGVGWSMRNCVIHSPVRYGLRVRNLRNVDAGDWSMSDCVFSQSVHAADAAIRVESSGGVKITNIKINGLMPTLAYGYGIDATDVSLTTSIFQVSNSSIENIRTAGIRITGWILVVLANLEFGIYSGTAPAVYFNGAADSSISNIVARSNGTGVPAVLLNDCARIKMGALHADGFNPKVAYTGTYSESGYSINNGWTSATFENGWANVGSPFPTTQYRIDGNTVWVKAGVQAGTMGSTIFTLPLGLRPQELVIASAWENGTMRWVSINPDGTVVHSGGSNANVSFLAAFPNN